MINVWGFISYIDSCICISMHIDKGLTMNKKLIMLFFVIFYLSCQVAIASYEEESMTTSDDTRFKQADDDAKAKKAQDKRTILRALANARRHVTSSTYQETRNRLYDKIMEVNPSDYQQAIDMSYSSSLTKSDQSFSPITPSGSSSNSSPTKSPNFYDRVFRAITPSGSSFNSSPTKSPSLSDRVLKVITPSSSSKEFKEDYDRTVLAAKILLLQEYDCSVEDLEIRSLRKWSSSSSSPR